MTKKGRCVFPQLDDKPCHQAGRVLRKSADKTNRGENCTKYCEPRFVLNEKIEKIKENPRINFSDSLLYESKFYVFFVFCAFVSGLREDASSLFHCPYCLGIIKPPKWCHFGGLRNL